MSARNIKEGKPLRRSLYIALQNPLLLLTVLVLFIPSIGCSNTPPGQHGFHKYIDNGIPVAVNSGRGFPLSVGYMLKVKI